LHSGIGYRDKLFHVTMAYQRQAISQEFLEDINNLNTSLEGYGKKIQDQKVLMRLKISN
jgi:hypothetical protein